MTEVDDFLAHYGIPGMKWGRHKTETTGNSGSVRTEKMTTKLAINILRGKQENLTNPRKAKRTATRHLVGRGIQATGAVVSAAYFLDRGIGSMKLSKISAANNIAAKQAASAFMRQKGIANYPVVNLVKSASGSWG